MDRAKTPWVVVVGHRQMYTSLNEDRRYQAYLQRAFEGFFEQYSVDVYHCGHGALSHASACCYMCLHSSIWFMSTSN